VGERRGEKEREKINKKVSRLGEGEDVENETTPGIPGTSGRSGSPELAHAM